MKRKERIELIGKLYCKYHNIIEENSLRSRVVYKMLHRLVSGKNPILEGCFQAYDMPGPYDDNSGEIWEYLENLAEEAKTTPMKYAAEYYHNDPLGAMCYQDFAEMLTNIVYQRISEEIMKEMKDPKLWD